MIALEVLTAFIALLAAAVAGIALATRNPRLTARLRQAEAERGELRALAGRLQRWAQDGLDDPQRRVVYDEITAMPSAQAPTGNRPRGLARKDGPHGL